MIKLKSYTYTNLIVWYLTINDIQFGKPMLSKTEAELALKEYNL